MIAGASAFTEFESGTPELGHFGENCGMARWPRHIWTTLFTYGAIFILFPLLGWLAYAWVQGWLS